MGESADPLESSNLFPGRTSSVSEQWLGGEAFLGHGYRPSERPTQSRVWSRAETLALCLGALTLGTALGLVFGRSSK